MGDGERRENGAAYKGFRIVFNSVYNMLQVCSTLQSWQSFIHLQLIQFTITLLSAHLLYLALIHNPFSRRTSTPSYSEPGSPPLNCTPMNYRYASDSDKL